MRSQFFFNLLICLLLSLKTVRLIDDNKRFCYTDSIKRTIKSLNSEIIIISRKQFTACEKAHINQKYIYFVGVLVRTFHKITYHAWKVSFTFLNGHCLKFAKFHVGIVAACLFKVALHIRIAHKLFGTCFDGQRRNSYYKFVYPVTLMQFVDDMRVNISFTCAGFHFNIQIQTTVFCMGSFA